jgi:hypothetical protein
VSKPELRFGFNNFQRLFSLLLSVEPVCGGSGDALTPSVRENQVCEAVRAAGDGGSEDLTFAARAPARVSDKVALGRPEVQRLKPKFQPFAHVSWRRIIKPDLRFDFNWFSQEFLVAAIWVEPVPEKRVGDDGLPGGDPEVPVLKLSFQRSCHCWREGEHKGN